jgi:PhzF family phenazine biosynthesis protein
MPVLHIVEAFATDRFTGNPAAVCVLDAPAAEDWMQRVAREMNLSETAYLHPIAGGYSLRWFTPSAEVRLCGHATLASAFTDAGWIVAREVRYPSSRPRSTIARA